MNRVEDAIKQHKQKVEWQGEEEQKKSAGIEGAYSSKKHSASIPIPVPNQKT